MRRHNAAPNLTLLLVTPLILGAVHFTSPWPIVQAVVHVFLVLGLAPEFRSPLVGVCWAGLAGWVLEGSLRLYPHLGGTALANMIVCLLVTWTLNRWPPRETRFYWGRMAVFTILHTALVHLTVRVAAGPHPWDSGAFWALVLLPVWATLAFKIYRPRFRE